MKKILFLLIFSMLNLFASSSGVIDSLENELKAMRSVIEVSDTSMIDEKIKQFYNQKDRLHRLHILRKDDMPLYLQNIFGVLPFNEYSNAKDLNQIYSEYFSALSYDKPDVRTQTEELYTKAISLLKYDKKNEEAIKALYQAGWQMGNPKAVSKLVQIFKEMKKSSKEQKLALVLETYPKDDDAVLMTIHGRRISSAYRHKKEQEALIRQEDQAQRNSFDSKETAVVSDEHSSSGSDDDTEKAVITDGMSEGLRRRK